MFSLRAGEERGQRAGSVDQTRVCAVNDLRHDRVRATTKPFFTKKENGAEAAQPPARDPGPESTCALELSRICPTLPRQELARPCGDVFPMEPPVRTGCTELQHPDKES